MTINSMRIVNNEWKKKTEWQNAHNCHSEGMKKKKTGKTREKMRYHCLVFGCHTNESRLKLS